MAGSSYLVGELSVVRGKLCAGAFAESSHHCRQDRLNRGVATGTVSMDVDRDSTEYTKYIVDT